MFICLPEDKQTGIQIIIEEEFTHCIKENLSTYPVNEASKIILAITIFH
jgi:hypothetical protein